MILVTIFFLCCLFLYWLALKMWLRDLLDRKQALLDDKNIYFLKSRNWSFFKGVNPWFLVKNWTFYILFFRELELKILFWDLLDRKQALLDYKNFHFLKFRNFPFFLCKLGVKILLGDLLDRKQALLEDKNFHFLMSHNWIFFKGVNPWFWSKNLKFYIVCFYAN